MTSDPVRIRPVDELDLDDITAIDEKISGEYRPEVWEERVGYYLRSDPESSVVAEADSRVVGFMLGEVRAGGEFGVEEPAGWIEVMGVDPDFRSQALGRRMAEAMLEHFKERGATSVRTLVDRERDDLTRFFAALGFEEARLRPFVREL